MRSYLQNVNSSQIGKTKSRKCSWKSHANMSFKTYYQTEIRGMQHEYMISILRLIKLVEILHRSFKNYFCICFIKYKGMHMLIQVTLNILKSLQKLIVWFINILIHSSFLRIFSSYNSLNRNSPRYMYGDEQNVMCAFHFSEFILMDTQQSLGVIIKLIMETV